jgi:hypothetical protein
VRHRAEAAAGAAHVLRVTTICRSTPRIDSSNETVTAP